MATRDVGSPGVSDIERIVDQVAGELGWLDPAPVFLGGSIVGLFLDAFGRSHLRPTKDVDCIVQQVLSRAAWWQLEEQLRTRGWAPDPSGPICRYRSPGGALVDLMSEDPSVLGFAGRWYPSTVANAQPRMLVTGRQILVPTPEHLLACKLEAWHDRGKRDPLMSNDLEDIVALLDSCPELEARVRTTPSELREWTAQAVAEFISNPRYKEAALGQLPRAGNQASREEKVMALMSRIAQLSMEAE